MIFVRPGKSPVSPVYAIRVIQEGRTAVIVAEGILDLNEALNAMQNWLQLCKQPGDRVELIAAQKEQFDVVASLQQKIAQKHGFRSYQDTGNIVPIRAGKIKPSTF